VTFCGPEGEAEADWNAPAEPTIPAGRLCCPTKLQGVLDQPTKAPLATNAPGKRSEVCGERSKVRQSSFLKSVYAIPVRHQRATGCAESGRLFPEGGLCVCARSPRMGELLTTDDAFSVPAPRAGAGSTAVL